MHTGGGAGKKKSRGKRTNARKQAEHERKKAWDYRQGSAGDESRVLRGSDEKVGDVRQASAELSPYIIGRSDGSAALTR